MLKKIFAYASVCLISLSVLACSSAPIKPDNTRMTYGADSDGISISYKGNIGRTASGGKDINPQKLEKARLRIEAARLCYEKKHKRKYVYRSPIENEKYERCDP